MPQPAPATERAPARGGSDTDMTNFLLTHKHEPAECEASFAAWHGFDSPLRGNPAPSTCLSGDHRIWWWVKAGDESEALAQLPDYVAERTEATRVRPVEIP
jgi:hypothetical protein